MAKIGRAFRGLTRQVSDASKNEDSLRRAATIRQNAEAVLKLQPAKVADIPAEQRAQFVADYRKKIEAFIQDVDALEGALKAGKNDEAAVLVRKMKRDMDEGHKEFRKKTDDDEM